MAEWVNGYGNPLARLLVVGEAPGADEVKEGIPFFGRTGQELDNYLIKILRMRREEIYTTNLFRYQLNDKKEYSDEEFEMMGSMLAEEIADVDPHVIMTLGAISTRYFIPDMPDMEAVNSLPHWWRNPVNNVRYVVVPSFHPAAAFHESSIMQWVIDAFNVVRELLNGGTVNTIDEVAPLKFDVVDLESMLHSRPKAGTVIAIDTEAYRSGLPYMVQATTHRSKSAYLYVNEKKGKKLMTELSKFVSDPAVTTLMHNAPYDLPILEDLGIYPRRFLDTMQIAFLLQTLPMGLKSLAYRLLGVRMKEYGDVIGEMPDLSHVDERERINYACGDPVATIRVYTAMRFLYYDRMEEVIERDMGIIPMVCAMMKRGIKANRQYFDDMRGELTVRNMELVESMVGKYPIVQSVAKTKTTKKEGTVRIEDFNPGSDKQVSELLYSKLGLGKGLKITRSRWGGSVDKNHLKKLENKHPIVPMIQEYRETSTLIDDFLSTLPEKIMNDGRIHTKISLIRVKHSGRLASSNPNLMAQPVRTEDGRRIRNGFEATPGFTLVSIDYCLFPTTRVLTMDLEWKMICDLREGDVLWGVEENSSGPFIPRHMVPSTVERVREVVLPSYKIITNDGKCVVASGEHPWLAKNPHRYRGNSYDWVSTVNLVPGQSEIWNALDVWSKSDEWEDGYLAGAFDGEGSVSVGRGIVLTFTQKPGIMLDFVSRLLEKKEYKFHIPWMGKGGGFENSHPVASTWISNRRDIARFLGTCRPQRLLDKAMMLFLGRRPPVGKSRVMSVTPIGREKLVSIQTSSKTFIAEGLITHNSQIEMRLMAHLSRDSVMCDIYRNGGDIHTETAMRAFGIKNKEDVDEMKHRYPAKRTGFGVINDISAEGLARELLSGGAKGWTVDRCEEFLSTWFSIYRGVKTFMEERKAYARYRRRVTDMWGRMEYIPQVISVFPHIREDGLRVAINQSIQSGAQGIIKQAMWNMWGMMSAWIISDSAYPLIQIHDDILSEVRNEKAGEIIPQMRSVMEGCVKLVIPVKAEPKTGRIWGELKKWKGGDSK